jgi:hypothetical protein
MVNRKPKGWSDAFEDAIPFIRQGRSKTVPKSAKTTVKAAHQAAKAADKAATSSAKYAFGDPKKGWQDVASNTAMWLVPYGKIGKGAKAVVKGRKTGKAASAAAQTAAALTAKPALDKALSKTKNVKPKEHKARKSAPKKGR